MSNAIRKSPQSDAVKEGAAELKEKLKADLSHAIKFRNLISLKPVIPCKECFGERKLQCTVCDGAGIQRVMLNDDPPKCVMCNGTGQITCVACSGKGVVENVYRKPLMWGLIIGGVALVLLFLQMYLSSHDLLPGMGKRGLTGVNQSAPITAPSNPGTAPAPR